MMVRGKFFCQNIWWIRKHFVILQYRNETGKPPPFIFSDCKGGDCKIRCKDMHQIVKFKIMEKETMIKKNARYQVKRAHESIESAKETLICFGGLLVGLVVVFVAVVVYAFCTVGVMSAVCYSALPVLVVGLLLWVLVGIVADAKAQINDAKNIINRKN